MEKTSQYSEKLLHRKLDLLLRTGKLLMESAADTSRIMRNMKRTAAYLGLPDEQTWATKNIRFPNSRVAKNTAST